MKSFPEKGTKFALLTAITKNGGVTNMNPPPATAYQDRMAMRSKGESHGML